ncbi:hypothetical protein CB0940_09432 [Cercospora beticola]|uniref:Alpha-carbonic anhydrase domain-containing protein n=1 Tax=Cercospora beticola TaxID=122368 RepID=A0A2G5HI14_CERBT|nr:hypothetical protein CB0940_09432 [Cercospora beticola]PIA92169.1 hypothetical protein CB0940_09432 [Cercospora beticola]WPB06252.1 hypothetical protein RHO25_010909 [Cercospora beticola]
MIAHQFLGLAALTALASACAPELLKRDGWRGAHLAKRAEPGARTWSFELAEAWNQLNPEWSTCYSGRRQSPINLRSKWGYYTQEPPTFHYPKNLTGKIDNWDFGPQFSVEVDDDNKTAAYIEFDHDGDPEIAYFRQWHVHTAAEHTIDGYRPKGEIHFVHYDDAGVPRSVIGFFFDRKSKYDDYNFNFTGPAIDATGSAFYRQLEPLELPDIFSNNTLEGVELDLNLLVKEAKDYKKFWTYKGSLTTPPCSEGIRWFISPEIIWLSDDQTESLLRASTFGDRPVNSVWDHDINV